ncbi:FMN-binding protein [Demequina sp. SYSU T00192]|uniref:FMN-binding protein n=1 Tax=Demequina litoralis TaxID=3051660 RepID=A0ABT8G9A6_9MICO|nr:FMN-binding protein [Demequina sp. SYSU T00192]MDN4475720.1 FMN-binding protein [Demequina sp. SYSU T00192]
MRTMTRTVGALAFAGAATTLLAGCGGDAEAEPAAATTAYDPLYADGVYDGPVETNPRGDYQAQVAIEGGVITDVQAIQAGTQDAESVSINARAIPELREKVLEAQSADIEEVSGASYTSPAFTDSVAGALEDAAEAYSS